MADPKAEQKQAAAETTELSLLDQIVEKGRFGGEAPARERGRDMIKQFVSEVLAGTITMARDTEAMLNARIAQIDKLLSGQPMDAAKELLQDNELRSAVRSLSYEVVDRAHRGQPHGQCDVAELQVEVHQRHGVTCLGQ